nr:sensor histidine kinase [Methanofollis sp. W23]
MQARKKTQERLNLAIEGGSLGVWDWDVATGEISLIHGWVKTRDDRSLEEETHVSTLGERIHPDDRSLLMRKMAEVRDDTMPYYEGDCRLQGHEGGWRWVHVRGKVTARDHEGHPARATGISRDVTEVHRAQDALREANKKLDLLSTITRHDLLNQLSTIVAYNGMVEGAVGKNETLKDFTRRIAAASETIREQIVFMHDYRSMGVKAPAWQCVEAVARAAGERASRGDLEITILTGRLEIFADPLFEKILFNLVDNTLRHGKRATKAMVSFREEQEEGVIVYEDDGVGVPPALKEKIFTRGFGREDSGLGLFLVREILAITGMTITETGGEGEGARFEIVVPAGGFRWGRSLDMAAP